MKLRREVIQSQRVWLVGEDENNPGTFRIVEGEGLHGGGGWTIHVGCVVHWVEDSKVYLTRERAEARVIELLKERAQ